ncbi:Cobalamin biosynthesis protein CobD [Sulfitobacter noctilucicola]|uniref:Cobalamin biosynthesis protein CobD n=1 Tax=Sulfitobacter noctilucicola TaxID=1342301 RepID=A0A7W6M645_9RHOB|nr:adenosylcobinamide-phosphate synthase CbiB [Sulfitobacter noctilucicola]KIN62332.1 Cobalamin biosynthesis protein CobD [Sulfitobacter noctilucicola]MBB4173134.1 adenosylcobinamide-phosphate synthase [Sulfitobacter noctilucicola]
MNAALILTCALVLDALMGEPRWIWQRIPHPAVLMGRLIGEGDKRFNTGRGQKAKGVALVLALILIGWAFGLTLSVLGPLFEIFLVAVLLAHKSLIQHVQAVASGLRMSIGEGRRAVALIVSRDSAQMSEPAVARSAIESAAENMSDGIIAPAFWFLLGGLPGIIIYKLVNTADSMIGYKNARYAEFGWAAARLDDVLNWVPARLTAAFIAIPARVLRQWQAIRADAALHRSPNAGWPEAAMARAIHVALAGPRAYDGKMQEFSWVNADAPKLIGAPAIDAAVSRLWHAWAFFLGCLCILGLIW